MTQLCGICAKPMVRFENPERYECTNTSQHAAIQRVSRQSDQGRKNTGQKREKSRGNLGDHASKGKGKS